MALIFRLRIYYTKLPRIFSFLPILVWFRNRALLWKHDLATPKMKHFTSVGKGEQINIPSILVDPERSFLGPSPENGTGETF